MTDYAAALARFSYKPGVSITYQRVALQCGAPQHVLILATHGPNSRGGVDRAFTVTRAIAGGLDDEQVRDELVSLIAWWELHEAREWARWDGEIINEPHDPATGAAYGQAGG